MTVTVSESDCQPDALIVTVSESDARINRDTLAGFWITGKGLWQIFIGESLEMSSQRFKFCISLRP